MSRDLEKLNPPVTSFLTKVELVKHDEAIITLQTDYMREVLREASCGLQTDTVEGVVHDPEYNGSIDIHITSSFDFILERWVPVLISFIFGRTKKHYALHWKSLFESYGEETNSSWDSFSAAFPGVTIDWSDALRFSFQEVLLEHATKTLKHPNVEKDDLYSYLRSCNVHFQRSVMRIERNGAVVPPAMTSRFKGIVDMMTSQTTTFHEFSRACREMASEFPKVSPWLQWYLHPERASGFFPACQKFTKEEKSRFSRLSTSTNAQENVGKQFQYLFMNKNRKMGVNESILAAFKFVNRFKLDRRLTARGMSTAYAQYPRLATPRKKRHVKNDGRAPDTNKSLRIEKKQKKLDLQNIPDEFVPSDEQESRDKNEKTSVPQTKEDSDNNQKPNPASTPPENRIEQSNYQDTLSVNDMIYHSRVGIDVVKDLRVESHRSRIVEVRALPDDSFDDDDDVIIVETVLGCLGLQSDAVVSKKPNSRGKAIKYFTLIPGVDETPISQTSLFRAAAHAAEEMEQEASRFSLNG